LAFLSFAAHLKWWRRQKKLSIAPSIFLFDIYLTHCRLSLSCSTVKSGKFAQEDTNQSIYSGAAQVLLELPFASKAPPYIVAFLARLAKPYTAVQAAAERVARSLTLTPFPYRLIFFFCIR
jgi:hypothetical protein